MYDIPDGFEMPFIDVYEVHPDDALISDLGVDGQLIATKHLPQPMHGFNYERGGDKQYYAWFNQNSETVIL